MFAYESACHIVKKEKKDARLIGIRKYVYIGR